MKKPRIILLVGVALATLFIIGCFCVIGGIGAYSIFAIRSQGQRLTLATPIPRRITPTIPYLSSSLMPPQSSAVPSKSLPSTVPSVSAASATGEAPEPTGPAAQAPTSEAEQTLKTLENSEIPVNDPIDLAERLEGKQNLPASLDFPAQVYQVGAQNSFWVMDSNTNQNFQVKATLSYITDHVYFWIEDGVRYDERQLKDLVETFENQIYPTNREFFGSEWTPGVDADPHLYILFTRGLGGSVAGYFSPPDEYLPVVREDSNGHEMFFLSADKLSPNEEFTYGVLAHEFQHMIHWYRDRNEQTWLNEGFSDLAMFLNGYSIGGHEWSYIRNPDLQLTDWFPGNQDNTPHYGASFLFTTYFLDRFGEDATKALVGDPENGMVSIDHVLAELGIDDPQTGQLLTADDVFADWELASFIQDGSVADGRYTYHNYPNAPSPSFTEQVSTCPLDAVQRDVSQYGADYIGIHCRGNYTLHFEAPSQVGVLPEGPHSGSYAYYSNESDESDMTLTRSFDFSDQSGPLTLEYWTWYDLEKDYDYLYLAASLDGENWQILTTPSGTADNPSGNSYGWGYNGYSGGGDSPKWIQESVDISQFAGKKVQLRFEYITDAAVTGDGFLLDDVAIPETGYFSDFENDDGGWQANGFVRIQNSLPQTFRLSLISLANNGTTIQKFELNGDNILDIPLQIGNGENQVVLVVSGVTRFTRQKAIYQYSILP
jgi:immune inhibitor A